MHNSECKHGEDEVKENCCVLPGALRKKNSVVLDSNGLVQGFSTFSKKDLTE